MDENREFVLTVTNYAVEEDGSFLKARTTIAPHMIQFIIASENVHFTIEGRDLRKVNVILTEGNNLEMFISEIDLICMERAIGTYFLP